MSVPNDLAVVTAVYSSGTYDLKTHEGQAAFVDAVVVALHVKDRRWGHLRKKPGQTNIHGHAEDAALYLSDIPGQSVAVDFIGGAGGPNPTLQWNPDQPRYSRADWFPPSEHDQPSTPAPSPVKLPLSKGEAFAALQALNAFYAAPEGLQRPGGLVLVDRDGRSVADMEAIAQWFHQLVIDRVSLEDVFTQIRNSHEWRSKHP